MKRILLLSTGFLLLGAPASYQLRAERDHKVLICHIPPGNPDNRHEILVDSHAVEAHVNNHGDTIGPCQSVVPQ